MRITIVHDFYPRAEPSGENDVVQSQCAALSRAGHDVTLVGHWRENTFDQESWASLFRTGLRVAFGTGSNPLDQVEESDPDLVHIHNLFPSWGDTWVRKLGAPFVTTVHNFRSVCSNGLLYRDGQFCDRCLGSGSLSALKFGCYRNSRIATLPLAISTARAVTRKPLFEFARKVIVLSRRSKDLLAKAGLSPTRTSIVPNFWPHEVSNVSRNLDRSGWVYAGRLSEEKGIRDLLRHWPDDEKLTIYGSGPLEIELRADKRPNIQFGGFRPVEYISNNLGRFEGLVFPSRLSENMPLSYVQALSRGTPVIARAGSSVSDDISEWGTGVVADSFADIRNAISEIRKADSITSVCTRRFNNEFSEKVWLGRIERLYRGEDA